MSAVASYTWTIVSATANPAPPGAAGGAAGPPPTGGGVVLGGPSESFAVSGSPEGLLYPGAAASRIPLTLTNPNTVVIYVTALAVGVTSEAPGCSAAENLLITQSDASPLSPVVVPAGGSVTLPAQGITAPTIQLIDLSSVNQDPCKGAAFVLRYSGSAHA